MIGTNGEDDIALEASRVVEGEWGYACIEGEAVYIPVVVATDSWPLRRVLAHLHQTSGLTRFIFTAVLSPDSLRPHLRNIVREWDEYVEQFKDVSCCIEIAYEPPRSPAAGEAQGANPSPSSQSGERAADVLVRPLVSPEQP